MSATTSDFAAVIQRDIVDPINGLCEIFIAEGAHAEFVWFHQLLTMFANPADEVAVLAGVIELSKCAFLGFSYSPEAAEQIDALLADAIEIAHTMSAPGVSH